MNGTHALGQIRAVGVVVEMAGDGLKLTPAKREAVEIAKANKPAIIAAMQLERFDGMSYESSGCCHWIERVYDAAYALSHYDIEVSILLKRLRAIDDAMSDKFDRERFDREASQIREMCGPIIDATGYLGGKELHDAVRREVERMGRDMDAFAA